MGGDRTAGVPAAHAEREDLRPGTAADDGSAAVDYITFEFSPTADVPSAPVVPTNDIVIPSPATDTSNSGCEAEDFPAATAEPSR